MSKENTNPPENQSSIVIEDLTLNETVTETVKGGDATIRVHYDTGYGNRMTIRG
ncbi:MAG: hypothetical protein AB1757_21685 [Acidobacteriota bacterium]